MPKEGHKLTLHEQRLAWRFYAGSVLAGMFADPGLPETDHQHQEGGWAGKDTEEQTDRAAAVADAMLMKENAVFAEAYEVEAVRQENERLEKEQR